MNNQFYIIMTPKDKKYNKDGSLRKPRGGKRPGAGRKPKSEEQALIEKLNPLDELAFKTLKKGITAGNYKFLELYMKYKYGSPKQSMDITSDGEGFNMPLIQFFNQKK